MEHIYILKLGDGKYYIGKTKNVEKRWTEHITGNGSGWTKRYKPMSLIKTVVSTSYFDEASAKMEDIMKSSGAPVVRDEKKILDILGKDKAPEFIGDGYYTRSLSKVDKRITKRLYGRPK